MPYKKSLQRFSRQSWDSVIAEFNGAKGDGVMESVVAGCAIVAYADGWATVDEKRRMLGLIRGFTPLAAFGIADVLHYFEQLTERFEQDHDTGEAEALAVVAKLKGLGRYPALLVETCCAIADADGGFDAEERKAAARICEALGLEPADFDLVEAS